MCEREEVVKLLSLPEEVLIKIAQHLGKWQQLAQACRVADPDLLYIKLNPTQALLNPDPGFAESRSKLCRIQKLALLNPDRGFAESRSRIFKIMVQSLLNSDPDFAESGSKIC